MSCIHIVIGCQLSWTFLSGSLPFYVIQNYIDTSYLILANEISNMI